MKYTDLRKKVRAFPIFSSSMLDSLAPHRRTLQVQLSTWKKKGLIRSLRRGLYLLGPEERQVEPPLFFLANQILIPSYVSLESALAYYGLIPEFVAATTSVTARKSCRFKNDFGLFIYQHVLPTGYGGFTSIKETGKFATLVATPEKAVVDFLYLNLSRFSVSDRSPFLESYRFQNTEVLQPAKLRGYAKRFGMKKLLAVVNLLVEEVTG